MTDTITIRGARQNNLKNVTLSLPKNRLIVLTGLSGSGKSTLAFDTLHTEGQRQYLESLGLVGYNVTKPRVDAIEGLSPSISVDQRLTNHSPRSTVGTATEVFTYLRVLFARLGHRPCPACGRDVPPSLELDTEAGWDDEPEAGQPETQNGDELTYPCPHCGAPVVELSMGHFSFNKPAGACPTCTGLGLALGANLDNLIDPAKSIPAGGVIIWDRYQVERYVQTLEAAGRWYGFGFDPDLPVGGYSPRLTDLLLHGVNSAEFRRHFPDASPPPTVRQGYFEGLVTGILRRYTDRSQDAGYRQKMAHLVREVTCPDCGGTRLRLESRQVTVAGRSLVELAKLSLKDLALWLDGLPEALGAEELLVAGPVLVDLNERLRRLIDVGVGYLSQERGAPSLSAGEAQRLRLAALLGSGLTGVMYILDEPTIGLHPRDIDSLVRVMQGLRDLGNTVIVIEHDPAVMRAADFLVEVGPGGGRHGGEIVAAGSREAVIAAPGSLTGAYLSGRRVIPVPEERRPGSGQFLSIYGARVHNLKNLDVHLPLGTLIAVTGVSGSGKSSLMFDVLDRAARRRFYRAAEEPGAHDRIEGWEHLDRIVTVDQTAIGRSPRSNAATYTDAFTAIREAFAATPAARERGLTPGHFSFNVPGGRCERCGGSGLLLISMHFLPDVQVRCPACRGRRFTRPVLEVQYDGYDIAQVLDLTIEEALEVFAEVPAAAARLQVMVDVGMGYLQLGQPATTLSGGEAQRVKLARELYRRTNGGALYLLDEPTTGLHMEDTWRLLDLLQRLVSAGNTVVMIEHNLDAIKVADWVIDLGPEGGEAGGELIAAGTPEEVARVEGSYTGRYLREVL